MATASAPPRLAAAVLAAGGSTRFGAAPKLLAPFRGRPLVAWAVEAALESGAFDVVFVVEGAVDLAHEVPAGAILLPNPAWADGQATSLATAVHAARVGGFDALVVGLGDQPFVGPEAWRAVATASVPEPIVVATYEGERGNPVRLGREVWDELPESGDHGARHLMAGPRRRGSVPRQRRRHRHPGGARPMELTNTFDVSVPVDTAWAVLTDVERIAPCLPGAQLQEIEGDEYRGIVKVKVGPITAQYKGKATFLEKDDVNHKAVLDASGRDTRGQGNASATITAQLEPDAAGTGTTVTVTTDLTVTGKVAQFGRGVLADVSAKILGQFVDNLEQTVLTDDAIAAAEVVEEAEQALVADAAAAAEALEEAVEAVELVGAEDEQGIVDPEAVVAAEIKVEQAVRKIDMPEPEAIDLLESAGSSVLKRIVPVLGVALVVLVLWRVLRRRT